MAETNRSLKTFKSYAIGLIVSVLLTLIAFYFVHMHLDPTNQDHLLSQTGLIGTIMGLAVLQLFVQVVCFLRLNTSPEGKWELMPFLVAIFIVLVFVFGTIWIMYNLNYNMMH